MAKKARRDPLMVAVWAEVGAGRIREDYICDPHHFVDGETQHTGHITINPAPAVVDTIVHEILHRLRPAWSERYVRRTTSYLMRRMTDEEIQALYEEYQRRVRRRRRRRAELTVRGASGADGAGA